MYMTDVTGGDGIYSGWIGNVSATSLTYSIHYVAYGVEGLAQVDSGRFLLQFIVLWIYSFQPDCKELNWFKTWNWDKPEQLVHFIYWLIIWNIFDGWKTRKGKYERAPTTAGYITKTAAVSAVTQFNRMGYGPSLMVQSRAQPSIDVIPPQRITDLNIAGYNPSTGQVNLTWSPPLDDFGLGSVGKSNRFLCRDEIMQHWFAVLFNNKLTVL